MKVISKEEEKAHFNQVIKGGLIGGSISMALGLTGVVLASRRWTAFRSLTLPFRTFLVTSSATAGAVITAERYSINFQRAKDPMSFYKDASQRADELARQQESSWKRFVDYCRENRYTIVGLGWVASMAVAFTLVSRNRYLTTSQKLVQARVYAQGLTLALILAAGAFETADAKSGKGRWESVMVVDPKDPEHKHMIEKRVHKEEYEGQDLWKDMVAAEERRLAAKNQSEPKGKAADEKDAVAPSTTN
ncbi:mitochondrial hypoxia responsive domain-containing protein [Coniochaeta sp. PMI_546]|nr:mitochondrial hypoxia responsive domain-containing protein [Coniochaeta sp. PMI_546]